MTISRRHWLQQSAALGGLAMSGAVACAAIEAYPTVDCHTHFYDPKRKEGVPWPDKQDSLLYRPVLPEEFRDVSKPLGVTGTIVVEASPWLEDNQWLLDLAKDEPKILGVVGNLKPGTEDFRRHVERFAKNALFRGIRVNVGDLKKGLEQPGYLDDLRAFRDAGLALDVNGGPDTPAQVARLAEVIPDLTIVINHCGNLRIDGQAPPADWLKGMQAAAMHPHVYCKVSALVEGTGKRNHDAPRNVDFYRPVLDALWMTWGDDKLVYGSNWPVCLRAASYKTVFSVVHDYVAKRPGDAQEKFFSRNSVNAYRWKSR
jgi:predicted TIM-barrel fold metal-dependent hydrolase